MLRAELPNRQSSKMVSAPQSRPTSDPSKPLLNPKAQEPNLNAVYGIYHQEIVAEISGLDALSHKQTTLFQEIQILCKNSAPLIVAYLLQYVFSLITISVVGHLGTDELAAVALALMTANITGYAVYEGLATSLDTLCAQAYGAGRLDLVGIHVQRMVCLQLLVTIPIGAVWVFSPQLLAIVVPEQDLARMAGKFLRVLLLGAPGYALFEAGKRFVQAQGLFHGPLLVMLIGLPINILLNWLFVFKLGWGFTGAALALSITRDILPVMLLAYVLLISPSSLKCWGGFGKSTFQDWGLMVKLSVPGIFMVEAEWLAFELQTLAASHLSATELAAQSVIMTVCVVMAHIPFSVAVAVSTRLGNLIGFNDLYAAKVATRACCIAAVVVGASDGLFVILFRRPILNIFTEDEAVIAIASRTILVLAVFQIFDSTTAVVNGLLRGIGRQSAGAWINLFVYYLVRFLTSTELLLY
jgi:multidrug resistance protein, MATE family